ncbi:enterochelin esterase-like enzyme [Nakamurella sp. UYEF19]|uniref:alpha/beta hydrolase n=1 Tax=Nakamurella sp. UYEF19 TaxID=1756392 RepID=UPI00339A86AB
MGISRRAVIVGGAGALVLVVGGGIGLVEAGVLPGRARLDATLGRDGGGGTVPDIEPGPSISGSFRSTARRTTVGYSILRPPGQTGTLPVAVVLHGRSVTHTEAVTGLHYDRYLAAAVAGGVPPFALVTVDGGDIVYWHQRENGDDPLTMIRDELLPIVAEQGLRTDRIGVTGWSMGGYGALLIGGQLGAAKVAAVAAISPALFADYASSSAGAYDSEADFEANDPRADPTRLDGIQVLIDCGTDDPFADQARAMRNLLHPAPAGAMTGGAHTAAYMTRVAPQQMAFLGNALHPA